jgi:hypothetical protein
MEFKLTIGFNAETLQAVNNFISALSSNGPATAKNTSNGTSNGSMKVVKPATEVSSPVTTASSDNKSVGTVTLEGLRKLVKTTADKSPELKASVKDLLAKFETKSVSDLAADKYDAFHSELLALSTVTLEDLRSKVTAFVTAYPAKKEALKALFAEFDTPGLSGLAEVRYQEFYDKLDEL